jgi:choice-of-anchor A domain-containing protein
LIAVVRSERQIGQCCGCDLSACLPNAPDVNLFLFGDATARIKSEGAILVGGSAELDDSFIGLQLSESYGRSDSLVVQKDLTLDHSEVHSGNVVYGGIFTKDSVDDASFMGYNGFLHDEKRFDFSRAKTCYRDLSQEIGDESSSGNNVISNNTDMLFSSSPRNSSREVFSTECSQLRNAQSVKFQVHGDKLILVNVHGTECAFNAAVMTGSDATRVLWNFVEAEILDLGNQKLMGSILAPNANIISSSNTIISGQLIADSLSGDGTFELQALRGCKHQKKQLKVNQVQKPKLEAVAEKLLEDTSFSLETSSGDLFLETSSGDLFLETSSGDLFLEELF